MNVLIADDDPIIIRLLSTELRKAGHATFIAYDVVQAIATIRRSRIDLVVLDMAMPGGSGADVIHRLKTSTRTGQIPIIVVSGSVEPEARDRLLGLGADEYFSKPPDLPALIDAVRQFTDTGNPALGAKPADTASAAERRKAYQPEESYCGA